MADFSYPKLLELDTQLQAIQAMDESMQRELGHQLLKDKQYAMFQWMYPHLDAFSDTSLLTHAANQNEPELCNLWLPLDNPTHRPWLVHAFSNVSELKKQEAFEALEAHLSKKQLEKLFWLTVCTQTLVGFKALLPSIRNTECLYACFQRIAYTPEGAITPTHFKETANSKSIFWAALHQLDEVSLNAILDIHLSSPAHAGFLLQAAPKVLEKGESKWRLLIRALPKDGRAEALWQEVSQDPTSLLGAVGVLLLSALEQQRLQETLPSAQAPSKLRL